MKKYLAAALLITTIVFTSCARQRKATGKKPKPSNTAGAGISMVSMGRGACFGRCPTYTLIINRDGLVQYRGRMFTDYTGVYEKKFTPQETGAVLQEFRNYRVDTCASNYEQLISDVPGIYYRITINGKMKEINNANFGPGFLKDLARTMDQKFPIDGSWKKLSADVPE